MQKLDLGEKKRKCALGGGGEERKTLWPRKKSVHCREREREREEEKCVRREIDFKKCHYCYDRSISMTELTLVICTCNLQFRPGL